MDAILGANEVVDDLVGSRKKAFCASWIWRRHMIM